MQITISAGNMSYWESLTKRRIKLVTLGDAKVGKSAILERFLHDTFQVNMKSINSLKIIFSVKFFQGSVNTG